MELLGRGCCYSGDVTFSGRCVAQEEADMLPRLTFNLCDLWPNNDAKVPFFFISREKFVFWEFLAKIE